MNLGSGLAQLRLGRLYRDGQGVAADPVAAQDLFARAAERGYADAMFELALLYDSGSLPGGRNGDLVLLWLRRAAERGHPDAMHRLEGPAARQASP